MKNDFISKNNVIVFLQTPSLKVSQKYCSGSIIKEGFCIGIKRMGLGQYAILGKKSAQHNVQWTVLIARLKWWFLANIQPLENVGWRITHRR